MTSSSDPGKMIESMATQLVSNHLITYAALTIILAILIHHIIKFARYMRKYTAILTGLEAFPAPKSHWLLGHLLQVSGHPIPLLKV